MEYGYSTPRTFDRTNQGRLNPPKTFETKQVRLLKSEHKQRSPNLPNRSQRKPSEKLLAHLETFGRWVPLS